MPTDERLGRGGLPLPAGGRWPVAAALTVAISFGISLAGFLLVRRASGALASPLPEEMLVAAGLMLLAWAAAVQTLAMWQARASQAAPAGVPGFARGLTTIVLVLFAVACSWPGGRLIDWAVWLPVIGASWLWPHVLSSQLPALWAFKSGPGVSASAAETRRVPPRPVWETTPADDAEPDQVMQQLTRLRTAEGQEIVQGLLVAEFESGERNVTLHAAFCPPFQRLPCVEASAVDGSPASVKLVQVLHQGVQLEVQLARPSEQAQRVSIELLAADAV